MTLRLDKHSDGLISTALVVAARETRRIRPAVDSWVVRTRARQMICQSATLLDLDISVAIPVEADAVVIVAIAPTRVAPPVVARVEVFYGYRAVIGFRVRAVDAYTSKRGTTWTSLRSNDVHVIVPPLTPIDGPAGRSARKHPRDPRPSFKSVASDGDASTSRPPAAPTIQSDKGPR